MKVTGAQIWLSLSYSTPLRSLYSDCFPIEGLFYTEKEERNQTDGQGRVNHGKTEATLLPVRAKFFFGPDDCV